MTSLEFINKLLKTFNIQGNSGTMAAADVVPAQSSNGIAHYLGSSSTAAGAAAAAAIASAVAGGNTAPITDLKSLGVFHVMLFMHFTYG